MWNIPTPILHTVTQLYHPIITGKIPQLQRLRSPHKERERITPWVAYIRAIPQSLCPEEPSPIPLGPLHASKRRGEEAEPIYSPLTLVTAAHRGKSMFF